MGKQLYTGRQVNLGSATGLSIMTGNPWYVGDYAALTCSVTTGAAAASRITILASNEDGFNSTLSSGNPTAATNQWSIATVLTAPGMYTIDAGIRWINALRAVAESGQTASTVTVIFAGKT